MMPRFKRKYSFSNNKNIDLTKQRNLNCLCREQACQFPTKNYTDDFRNFYSYTITFFKACFHKTSWLIGLLLLILLPGCYTIKNKNDARRINLQTFKNNTTIFGLENELSQFLPTAFRKETGFRTGNTNQGYVVRGQILDYKKKVVRKTTSGDPTHQQVTIEVQIEFLENDKVLNTQKITNTSYRIDSGLYNSTIGESESFGRQIALMDISEAIAQNINYYFLEN